MFEILEKKPFNLTDKQLTQVKEVYDSLSDKHKVAQLFTLLLMGNNEQDIQQVLDIKPGGICRFFSDDLEYEHRLLTTIIDTCEVAPLFSADLEGSHQSLNFGTQIPGQLAISAVDDVASTYSLAAITAREAKAIGVRWSFTPVIDINQAFRSSIVGTRSYGSDISRIKRHALAHIKALQAEGLAATVKHWPGEGFDDRDQHLVTTVNPLSVEQWQETFGSLFRSAIDEGVMSVMSAHIAFPAYIRSKYPDAGKEAFLPASINKTLNVDLLRHELGFNGVIVSDATEMAGLAGWYPEPEAIVRVLEAGNDMILFSRHPQRDIQAILDAVASGRLAQSRINEALIRILGLKAKLSLLDCESPVSDLEKTKTSLSGDDKQKLADEIAGRAPVLEKNLTDDLPISVDKHKRVLVVEGNIYHPLLEQNPRFIIPELLEKEGFCVTRYNHDISIEVTDFDLVIYLLGDESLLTKGRIFLDWAQIGGGIGKAMIRPWTQVSTILLSFGHPYHLYDAPQAPVYINGWHTTEQCQKAVFNCIMGRAPWNTNASPVDAFCGMESLQY